MSNKIIPFEKSFASHAKAEFWSDKNTLKPESVTQGSHNKIIFNCYKCDHEFISFIQNIVKGMWCPYCCVNSRTICSSDDCNACFDRSFASSEKSKYWSIKNKILPREITKSSNKKFIFNCDKCNHEFESSLKMITNGFWCIYCGKNSHAICGKQNCDICVNKSFEMNPKKIYWSEQNKVKPWQVFNNCNDKFWFKCDKCPHEFETSLNNINGGKWCSYCSSSKLCNDDCETCFGKTLASNPKSVYWSPNNNIQPRNVFKYSDNKYLFICKECNNEFSIAGSHVTEGKWCPLCVNKTEKIVYNGLLTKYANTIHNFRPIWCVNLETQNILPFDICIPEFKIIVEIDGLQHFAQVRNWDSPENIHKKDVYKQKCANKNGYSIIRILQNDVYKNKYDWLSMLDDTINTIKKSKKIQNIYICQNDEYSIFYN